MHRCDISYLMTIAKTEIKLSCAEHGTAFFVIIFEFSGMMCYNINTESEVKVITKVVKV